MRVGPRLLLAEQSPAPWLHFTVEDESGAVLELIAPDVDVLYTFLRGLAALLPLQAQQRYGELAWARARLIVKTFAGRQGLTYAQAWTQIIVEAAASAATFTPSRLSLAVSLAPKRTPGEVPSPSKRGGKGSKRKST